MAKRIGLIGGMSWESTSSHYSLLNQLTAERLGPWRQPEVLGRILADSARRLEAAGATVLAICANTMHVNIEDARGAVSVPILDIRDCVAREVRALGADSLSLLRTRCLIEMDFYAAHLEAAGIRVVRPTRSRPTSFSASCSLS